MEKLEAGSNPANGLIERWRNFREKRRTRQSIEQLAGALALLGPEPEYLPQAPVSKHMRVGKVALSGHSSIRL